MKSRRRITSMILALVLAFGVGLGSAYADELPFEVSLSENLGSETMTVPIYDWETNSVVEQEVEMNIVPDGAVLSVSTEIDLSAVVIHYGEFEGAYSEDGPVYWTVGGEMSGLNYLEAGTTGTVVFESHDIVSFYKLQISEEGYEQSYYFTIMTVEPVEEQPAEVPATVTAIPTPSIVLVDGELVDFEAYNINDSNYFKLRDIAAVLNGTLSQFSVGWDAEANAISLTSGESYTFAGGELEKGDFSIKSGVSSNSVIYLDGTPVDLTAYNIDGNNYFKLRDLARALNFGVGWDGATSTITIDSTVEYVE